MTSKDIKSSEVVRHHSLDDIPAASSLIKAANAMSDAEMEQRAAAGEDEEIWPTRAERVFSIEQAQCLKEQAREGGLRFEAYLPPALAVWLLELVEQGIFNDPSHGAFVLLGEAHELQPHADLRTELLRRMFQAAMDDPRPAIPAEEVFKELRDKFSAPQPAPAVWTKKTS